MFLIKVILYAWLLIKLNYGLNKGLQRVMRDNSLGSIGIYSSTLGLHPSSQSSVKVIVSRLMSDVGKNMDIDNNVKIPLIPRHGDHANLVAKWQAKSDRYLSYEHLQLLEQQLKNDIAGEPLEGRSRSQGKKTLFSELTLTYFARFHNIIREEYQYEKRIVEDRLRRWPLSRLCREGVTLVNLKAIPRGNLYKVLQCVKVICGLYRSFFNGISNILYTLLSIFFYIPTKEKVYRFTPSNSTKLGFHRFGVGDSVRITLSKPDHRNRRAYFNTNISGRDEGEIVEEEAKDIEGVVLDRRQGYLEVSRN